MVIEPTHRDLDDAVEGIEAARRAHDDAPLDQPFDVIQLHAGEWQLQTVKDMAALARGGFDQNTARRVLDCRDGDAVDALLKAAQDASA